MLSTSSIEELGTTRPDLYAFRVQGEVSRADMAEMARRMKKAFDAHDQVDMLLYFEGFEGSAPDAGLDFDTLKSQRGSLSPVRRYVVANAPERAEKMVEAFGKALPVDAEAYDSLDDAFKSLGAKSMTVTGQPAA